jgi:peptidoglycan/LPS O-acetylase OafA/YrhL
MRNIPSLDGLRAISIALVIFSHVKNTQRFPQQLSFLGDEGRFGVRVFFVISGFLITTLLLREHERTGTVSLKNFYLRRAYRIFPAAYALMLVTCVLFWSHLSFADISLAVTYLTSYQVVRSPVLGHIWSLSVEEQFYFIWPATFVIARVITPRRVAWAVMLLAPLFRLWLYYHQASDNILFRSFPVLFDALAAGSLLAIYKPDFSARKWLFIGFALLGGSQLTSRLASLNLTVGQVVLNSGLIILIDHCIRRRYWLLNCKPVAFIGILSYSLYLWQQMFLTPSGLSGFNVFPLNLVCVFTLATLSYYAIEKPFLALRDSRSKTRAAAVGTA